jgi:hypothetical protein
MKTLFITLILALAFVLMASMVVAESSESVESSESDEVINVNVELERDASMER